MRYTSSISESHHDNQRHRFHVIYVKKMRERRIFMEELAQLRMKRIQHYFKLIKEAVGPKWYYALSVNQRCALDGLSESIYRDILEGRPHRTRHILDTLGVYPVPKFGLLTTLYAGECDAMKTLAYLYQVQFGHDFTVERPGYCLNAKLILSSLFYLGLEDLISLLENTYKPDREELPPPKPKRKRKPRSPPVSPYLEKQTAKLYDPHQNMNPKKPPPLPDFTNLNRIANMRKMESVKPPPPPSPPRLIEPKPSKPRVHCDQLTGIMKFQPLKPVAVTPFKPWMPRKKVTPTMKDYLTSVCGRRKKPKAPTISLDNLQPQIAGVFTINNKPYFILSNVVNIRSAGFIVHGGHFMAAGEYTRIHGGVYNTGTTVIINNCDCMQNWGQTAFNYLSASKCKCNHFYDFKHNRGETCDETYFMKPTKRAPFQFAYEKIYNEDRTALYLGRQFQRLWSTDSVLGTERKQDTSKVLDNEQKENTQKTKNKIQGVQDTIHSKPCLDDHSKLSDYLICAIGTYKSTCLAANLPDVHLAPELKAWIRKRVYGNIAKQKRRNMLRQSQLYWYCLSEAEKQGLTYLYTPMDPRFFEGSTTWAKKKVLREKYAEYCKKYTREIYKLQVYANNLMWATMFNEQFPDKNFRQIFFSYLLERPANLNLIRPYDQVEVQQRALLLDATRRKCR